MWYQLHQHYQPTATRHPPKPPLFQRMRKIFEWKRNLRKDRELVLPSPVDRSKLDVILGMNRNYRKHFPAIDPSEVYSYIPTSTPPSSSFYFLLISRILQTKLRTFRTVCFPLHFTLSSVEKKCNFHRCSLETFKSFTEFHLTTLYFPGFAEFLRK